MDTSIPSVETDELVRTAFDRCPSGLMAVDSVGRIAIVNREVERLFGYAREELLGQSIEILVPGNFAEGHAKLRANYSAAPIARAMGAGRDLFGLHKDGRQIPVEIGLSSVATPHGFFILATVVDISARRRMEERMHQVHKLEALGTLSSGIAHDFNNLLAGILGYAEQIGNAVSGMPATVADVEVVIDAARRAQHLVNRILLFARSTEPIRARASLETPVREAIRLLHAGLPSNIEVRERVSPDTPQVWADSSELHEIVMNLATNAAHAMKMSGGVIEIGLAPVLLDEPFAAAHPGLRAGLYAQLSVSDTGTGIAPEVLDRIFEPFFTTKPQGEGTGLGLSVVDRIVHAMGGVVEVESRVGQGTRFSVYLPCAPTDPGIGRHQAADHSEHPSVLLVDDELGLALLGQRVLESAGFEVTIHTSSLQAYETFRAGPRRFDLLITDNAMPHMTGLELVDRISALRPDLPVLMLSGVGESMSMGELRKRGVTRLLAKPYESSTLRSTAKEMVAER